MISLVWNYMPPDGLDALLGALIILAAMVAAVVIIASGVDNISGGRR